MLALRNLLTNDKLQLGPDMVEAGLPKVVQQRITQVNLLASCPNQNAPPAPLDATDSCLLLLFSAEDCCRLTVQVSGTLHMSSTASAAIQLWCIMCVKLFCHASVFGPHDTTQCCVQKSFMIAGYLKFAKAECRQAGHRVSRCVHKHTSQMTV